MPLSPRDRLASTEKLPQAEQAAATSTDKPGGYSADAAPVAVDNCPPELCGYIFKKSPATIKLRRWDKRFLVVRNMHLHWWATQKDAEAPEAAAPDGGPRCKGVINLLANDCVIEEIQGTASHFGLSAKSGVWSAEAREKKILKNLNRIFTFDAAGSEHDRRRWIEAIGQHLERADVLKPTTFCAPIDDLVAAFPEDIPEEEDEFEIILDKTGSQKLGLTTSRKGAALLVDAIGVGFESAGLVESWNAAHPEKMVKPGDRLVEANGVRGNFTAMMDELIKSGTLHLTFAKEVVGPDLTSVEEPVEVTATAGPWQVGDIAFFTAPGNQLPDGSMLMYGDEGCVIRVGEGEDANISVKFEDFEYSIGCSRKDISREEPPNKLSSGFSISEFVYYIGGQHELPDGSEVTYGSSGMIVGPACMGEDGGEGVAVRFRGVTHNVACSVGEFALEQPAMTFAGGLEIGDRVSYQGPAFGEVKYNQEGKVVGPDDRDERKVAVKLDGLEPWVHCFHGDLKKK